MDRKFLYWGSFFVALGGVLLLASGNLVSDSVLRDALRLWPLVVIGFGAGVVLYFTRLRPAGGVLIAVAPGLLLGTVIAVAPRSISCGVGSPASFASQQGTFAAAANVDLSLACGELEVTAAQGTGWQLQSGSTENVAAQVDSGADHLNVRTGRSPGAFGFRAGRDVFRLTLPTANQIDLSTTVDAGVARLNLSNAQLGTVVLRTNAGETRANLTGAQVGNLTVDVNAGAAEVQLPDDAFTGNVKVNVGSVKVCTPPNVGLRVVSTAQLGATHMPGFHLVNGAWQSPNYQTADKQSELTVNVNLGSVDFNPTGGCL